MISITPHMRIYAALTPADFRCQIPGLTAICQQIFDEDPYNGAVFVFRNRTATSIKLLFCDGDGIWCCQRSLGKGRYKWWPKGEGHLSIVEAQELVALIWGGDPRGLHSEPWRRLAPVIKDGKEHEQHHRSGQGDPSGSS